MAMNHCSVKTISRSAGRSATAAVAYRSGTKIEDKRTEQVHDYTRKLGVKAVGIVAPEDAPDWAKDRSALWNQAELSENRKDARVAREVEVALPYELHAGQMRELTEGYSKWLSARYGVAVDWAIHQPHRDGDERNHHAHLMMTVRRLGPDGLGAKVRVLDDKRQGPEEIKAIREVWASHVNYALERAGHDARIDHRSLRAQGIDRVPQIHAGPEVTAMEHHAADKSAGFARRGVVEAARIGQATEIGKALTLIVDLNEVRQEKQSAQKLETERRTDIQSRWERRAEVQRHRDARKKAVWIAIEPVLEPEPQKVAEDAIAPKAPEPTLTPHAAAVGEAHENGGKLAAMRAAAMGLWEEQHPTRWYHRLPIVKGRRDKARDAFVRVKMVESTRAEREGSRLQLQALPSPSQAAIRLAVVANEVSRLCSVKRTQIKKRWKQRAEIKSDKAWDAGIRELKRSIDAKISRLEAAQKPKASEPMPAPARAQEKALEAEEQAREADALAAQPKPVETARTSEEHSPDLSDLEARRQKLLDFVKALSTDAVTNIEDVQEAYRVAGYEEANREKGKVWTYPPGDLLEERKAVTQARKGWKERADQSRVPEPRQTESAPALDEAAKKKAIRAAAKLGEHWQHAWDNSSIGTRNAAAGRVSTQIEAERKKIEAGDSPLTLSEFNKAVARGKQRSIER